MTGCSNEPGCDVMAPTGPVLHLTVDDWFHANPTSKLHACFDGKCDDITAESAAATATGHVTLQGKSPVPKSQASYTLSIDSVSGTALPAGRETLRVSTTPQSGCGSPHPAQATLTAHGTLLSSR